VGWDSELDSELAGCDLNGVNNGHAITEKRVILWPGIHAIFTPIQVISPRFSQILSVFGDRVIGVENGIQQQALQSLPVIKSVT